MRRERGRLLRRRRMGRRGQRRGASITYLGKIRCCPRRFRGRASLRYKMNYIEWTFGELYGKGSTRFTTEIKVVEKDLEALYDKCVAQDKRARNGASSSSSTTIPSIPVQAGYESFLSARSTTISKSELRNLYPRYPIMAKISKRFLTIPATSVSSESTFSTSGRILDDYRSSLKPVMVEALVCGAIYIKGAHADLNIVPRDEDEEDDVETIILPVVEEINY